MKKAIGSLIWIFIGIMLFSSLVGALGVAPSKIDVFYQPMTQSEISFRIINNEHKDMDVALVSKGELSQYISFDQQKIHIGADEFEKVVTYKISFPGKLNPGKQTVEIMAIEDSSQESGDIVVANIGVIHSLTIIVPYPDQYIEGMLYVSEARPDEKVTFTVVMSNVGSKDINKVKGQILITNNQKEIVARISTNELSLKTGSKGKVTGDWIASVSSGSYHAQAVMEYDNGKILSLEKDFDVGEPLLEIESVRVGPFKLGTIAKFDITMKNKWNNEVKDIYASTEIKDSNGAAISSYKTGQTDIAPLGIGELTSYWNTQGVSPGKFILDIQANYLGRTRAKTYQLDVKEDKITVNSLTGEVIETGTEKKTGQDMTLPILVGSGIFLLILVKIVLDFLARSKQGQSQGQGQAPSARDESHPELKNYIKEKLKEGYSRKAILDNLVNKGWNSTIVEREMLKVEDEMGK